MSEYEQIIDEIVKHGVVIKVNKIVDDNYIPCERKYVGCVVELDFTEHDKPFLEKIKKLENEIENFENETCETCYKENLHMTTQAQVDGYRNSLYMAEKNYDRLHHENEELKQRISELESKATVELPFDPLECAKYLINSTYERETSSLERAFAKIPYKVNSNRYSIDELEQIAEHLLVYCKHNKENE